MTYDASKIVIEKSDHCDSFLEKLQTLKEEDPELDFVVEDVESISMECETTKECINLNFSQPEVTHPSSLMSSPSNVSSKVSSPTMRQLLSTTEGQMLKCMYESGKGELEGKQRVSISEFFIAREFENRGFPKTFTIDVKRFIQMRDEIHSEFPTVDKNLFFVPYEKETKTFAKGHLYKAFNNFKRNMGLTKAKKKRTDVTSDHDSSDAHDFVKHHLQPEETIKEFWTASRAERLEGFKTFYEYVIQYPILSTVKGYEYFLQDFEEEFPEQHNFAENWNKANKELTAYGLSKNSRFFKNLQKEIHEDLMGLHVLGFHLAVSSYSSWESNSDGTKRKRNKCSKQEVLNALFIYEKDNRLLLEEVAKHFSKRDKSPILAFVGTSKRNLTEFYVAVDKDVLYPFDNVTPAIDAYMKMCIVCKKTYPVVTAPVWTYIQKYVFRIEDSTDKFLSVFDLHNKISVFTEHDESSEDDE